MRNLCECSPPSVLWRSHWKGCSLCSFVSPAFLIDWAKDSPRQLSRGNPLKDMPALSMTILALDQRPVLKAEAGASNTIC